MAPTNGATRLTENGRAVASFGTQIQNYTRGSEFMYTIISMYRTGQWRAYQQNRGPVRWRAAEFDYFLIAECAPYEDVSRMLGYERASIELAPAMVSEDRRRRRPFADAAAVWPGDTGETLIARAQRLGWLPKADAAPACPVSSYARVIARDLPPLGTRARYYRTRGLNFSASRRRELDELVARLRRELTVEERRYVREQLVAAGAGRPRLNGVISRKTAQRRAERERRQIN